MGKYGGMTVNERLYEAGVWEDFDAAVAQKDVESITRILQKVELSDSNIEGVLAYLKLKPQPMQSRKRK